MSFTKEIQTLKSSHLLGLVCRNFLLEIVKSERFEPRNHFIRRWSMIILVGVDLNRTMPTVDNSPIQDYAHQDYHAPPAYVNVK